MCEAEALPRVEIVPYDPQWPSAYAAERANIIAIGGSAIGELEHIGSTSVPGLSARGRAPREAYARLSPCRLRCCCRLRRAEDRACPLRGGLPRVHKSNCVCPEIS